MSSYTVRSDGHPYIPAGKGATIEEALRSFVRNLSNSSSIANRFFNGEINNGEFELNSLIEKYGAKGAFDLVKANGFMGEWVLESK